MIPAKGQRTYAFGYDCAYVLFDSARDILLASPVKEAVAGKTDFMVGFKCDRTNGYKCEVALINLDEVANKEKTILNEILGKFEMYIKIIVAQLIQT